MIFFCYINAPKHDTYYEGWKAHFFKQKRQWSADCRNVIRLRDGGTAYFTTLDEHANEVCIQLEFKNMKENLANWTVGGQKIKASLACDAVHAHCVGKNRFPLELLKLVQTDLNTEKTGNPMVEFHKGSQTDSDSVKSSWCCF